MGSRSVICHSIEVTAPPLTATLKPPSNRPSYNKYSDWYAGRWWLGCYIWYNEEETGRGRSQPRPLLAVPNVTAHPSTASVLTSYYSMWHCNCLWSPNLQREFWCRRRQWDSEGRWLEGLRSLTTADGSCLDCEDVAEPGRWWNLLVTEDQSGRTARSEHNTPGTRSLRVHLFQSCSFINVSKNCRNTTRFDAVTANKRCQLFSPQCVRTGWAKLNGANAVSFVAVKHVLENFDNFWQVK